LPASIIFAKRLVAISPLFYNPYNFPDSNHNIGKKQIKQIATYIFKSSFKFGKQDWCSHEGVSRAHVPQNCAESLAYFARDQDITVKANKGTLKHMIIEYHFVLV